MQARAAAHRAARHTIEQEGYSVLPCIDKERDNGLFAKRFGGFQAVQTLNKHEARAIRPY